VGPALEACERKIIGAINNKIRCRSVRGVDPERCEGEFRSAGLEKSSLTKTRSAGGARFLKVGPLVRG